MQSTNDPRLLIGLGTADEVTKLTVRWPSGAVSTLEHLATDRTYEVVEPRGSATRSDHAPDAASAVPGIRPRG